MEMKKQTSCKQSLEDWLNEYAHKNGLKKTNETEERVTFKEIILAHLELTKYSHISWIGGVGKIPYDYWLNECCKQNRAMYSKRSSYDNK